MVMQSAPLPREFFYGGMPSTGVPAFDRQILEEQTRADQLAHERGQFDFFQQEALRLQRDGYAVTPEQLEELNAKSPEMMQMVIGRRTPGAERYSTVWNVEPGHNLPKGHISAEGTEHWGQKYVATDDRAIWVPMIPPPRPDHLGNLWSDHATLVQRAQVSKKVLQGWRLSTNIPFRPRGTLECDMPSATGGKCEFHGDVPWDVTLHQAAKHPTAYQFRNHTELMEERAAARRRDERAEERAERDAQVMQQMMAAQQETARVMTLMLTVFMQSNPQAAELLQAMRAGSTSTGSATVPPPVSDTPPPAAPAPDTDVPGASPQNPAIVPVTAAHTPVPGSLPATAPNLSSAEQAAINAGHPTPAQVEEAERTRRQAPGQGRSRQQGR